METGRNTFCKAERLCSKILIDKLFSGTSKSCVVYPLRAVYMTTEKKENAGVSVLVSVSKRKFKKAVDRNRVKRQIREAYRKNKDILLETLPDKNYEPTVAFIYLDNKFTESKDIEEKIKILLAKIAEKLE